MPTELSVRESTTQIVNGLV